MIFFPTGLNKRILLLTLSMVMGASLIIGLTALFVFYEHNRASSLKYNQELANYLAVEISEFVSDAVERNEMVVSQIERNYNGDFCKNLSIERIFAGTGTFDAYCLVDNKGKVINFYPVNKTIIGQDLSERPWFQGAFHNRETFVSEPYKAKTGNHVLVVASPILGPNKEPVGVLSSSLHLNKSNKLNSLIKVLYKGKTGHGSIISYTGKYIYHPQLGATPLLAPKNKAVNEVMQGKQGSVEIKDKQGRIVLVGYAPVPNLGWGVLVEQPLDEALASAKDLQNLLLVIVLGIIVLTFVVTYMEVRRTVQPLNQLVHGVQRVAQGDFAFELSVESRDEIGELTKSFNSMVSRIREQREEIEKNQQLLQAKNSELKILAVTDGLTKLYNHRHFQECFAEEFARAAREKSTLSLLLIDVDHFKYYNDLFGHQAGDKLLIIIGELIMNAVSPRELVARYGGEEFAILMSGITEGEAFERAEFIRKAIETYPFEGGTQQPDGKITVSIGLATYPAKASSKEQLFKMADDALYKAKCFSRNKVEVYFSVLDELSTELGKSDEELINSIKMLVRIINAKDKYTYGHSERVSRYSVAIARRLGMVEEEIKNIKMGAFLHDIGKIEISRSILTKRGALTSEEFDIIKRHSFWGAGIIKAVKSLAPILPMVKFHHERVDGSGYPTGLKGEEIPFAARILAVADSFDAMTSNRPYRERMSFQEAKEELLRNAGILFDCRVVEVFLGVLEEGLID